MSAEVMKVWEDIVEAGELLPFYGVDGNRFKLGAMALEAIEDESDRPLRPRVGCAGVGVVHSRQVERAVATGERTMNWSLPNGVKVVRWYPVLMTHQHHRIGRRLPDFAAAARERSDV